MTDQTPEALIAKARERAERPCVWSEGEVPRHVAEYLWDAVHDRHALLAYIDTLAADLALAAAVRRLMDAEGDEPKGHYFTVDSLAAALRTIPVPATYEEWRARVDASYEDDAAAIIQAAKEDERERPTLPPADYSLMGTEYKAVKESDRD